MDEIDLTDGNTKGRHAQPRGFVPSHLATPALRDRDNQRTQLEYAAAELGLLRAAADTITAEGSGAGIADRAAAVTVSAGLLRVQRLLRALAAGALVALVAAGLSVGGARPAAAATVPVSVSAIEAPQPDPAPFTQHPTRFSRGTWLDACDGNLFVAAPLTELVPGLGWLPSPWAKVVVQESTKRGIRTRAVLSLTNAEGIARGLLHVGGGIHYLRVSHPADLWTLGTTGTWRRVIITTEPCDVN